MRVRLRAVVALIAVGIVAGFANAGRADVVYTSRAAFDAAVVNETVITFDQFAPPGGFTCFSPQCGGPPSLTTSGVTFTSNGSMFVIDPGFYQAQYPSPFLQSDAAPSCTNVPADTPCNVVVATFPPVTAVGFDFGGLFNVDPTTTFDITLSDGFTYSATTADVICPVPTAPPAACAGPGMLAFIGFTSTTPLTSVEISMPDAPNFNAIDNFTIGTALMIPVPEPRTLGVLAIGLTMLFALLGTRRRLQPPACES